MNLVLHVNAKCNDLCSIDLIQDGRYIAEHRGNVPRFFPGQQHYGDYLQLEIDVATGQILNWPKNIDENDVLHYFPAVTSLGDEN